MFITFIQSWTRSETVQTRVGMLTMTSDRTDN